MTPDPTQDPYVTVDADYLADLRIDLRCAKRNDMAEYAKNLAERLGKLEHKLYRVSDEAPTAEQWTHILRTMTWNAVEDLEDLDPGQETELLVLNKSADLDDLVEGYVTVRKIKQNGRS